MAQPYDNGAKTNEEKIQSEEFFKSSNLMPIQQGPSGAGDNGKLDIQLGPSGATAAFKNMGVQLRTSAVSNDRRVKTKSVENSLGRRLNQSSKESNSTDGSPPDFQHQQSIEFDSLSFSSLEKFESQYHTDYEHIQVLGKGSFGVVFEAKNKMDDCHYAIKRISLHNDNEIAKKKVMREVQALAKLDHVGIVRYLHSWLECPPLGWQDKLIEDTVSDESETESCDSLTQISFIYIKMQLCKQETLKDWLYDNTQDRKRGQVLNIFIQIVTAVEYVHDCGLMHRDLKPANIFFTTTGVVKVGDFGLVTAIMSEQLETDEQCTECEWHTPEVGTYPYMSPETQKKVTNYSHKVDIYSLGIILFELFFRFDTLMERADILNKIREHKFPDNFCSEMPTECEFVTWLLSNDPEKRPSAKEILGSKLFKELMQQAVQLLEAAIN